MFFLLKHESQFIKRPVTIHYKPLPACDILVVLQALVVTVNETDRVMKKSSIIAAGLVVLLSTVFFASNAQSTNPTIKVLPTTNEGIVKLLVVGAADQAVDVEFYTTDGLVQSDAVKSGEAGFNKRYDIRKIMDHGFSMEVRTAGTSVIYKLAKASNNKLTPILVKTTYTYPLVASNN